VEAVQAVLETTPETPTPVITIRENKILRSDLQECVRLTESAAKAIQARDWNAAMKLRDAELREGFDSYKLTTSPESTRLRIPQEHRIRIAIIHVGAPASGMNPATRAAVAYCLSRGHTPIATYNGFPGLLRHHDTEPIGSVRDMKWIDVEDWANEGGSELGTNRGLPSEDMAKTAHCFEIYRFEALFIIGGFEAFASACQIRNNRDTYPSLQIPLIVLPATISNNVPGTKYSLGSDTCLNTLVGFCDAIRQSASASRRRLFVVETQGGYSGYLATIAGLAVGALAVYTPEDGIDLHTLTRDIDFIRKSFQNDQGASRAGKIILRNERASQDLYDADGGRRDHRGGTGQFLEDTFAGKSAEEVNPNPPNATIIGMQGSEVVFSPMGSDYGLEATQTNWGARLPRNQAWRPVKGTIDVLSGRPEDKE
ncbi:6-phosphofructokinase, alpha subunit, partial [Exophiala xenobiotica]